MIKQFAENHIKERPCIFDGKRNHPVSPGDKGKLHERILEVPWVIDKVSQTKPTPGSTLFDFGCNKAKYIQKCKSKHKLVTYGLDAKKSGKDFVDNFFHGMFDNKLAHKIDNSGKYDISTSISAIEHAGHKWHPKIKRINKYQLEICKFVIQCAKFSFISVPYGKRPGHPADKSRSNFYQFNDCMLDCLKTFASEMNKNYLEEIYQIKGKYWDRSDRDQTRNLLYRSSKGGSAAIACISIWEE